MKELDSSARFSSQVREKISTLETSDGGLLFEGRETAKWLDAILLGLPNYIGVVPIGSTMGGYANESSDIDLVVVLESPDPKEREMFDMLVRNFLIQQAEEKGRPVHLIDTYVEDPAALFRLIRGTSILTSSAFWAYLFSPNAIGPGIERYRAQIASEMQDESKETRNAMVRKLVGVIIDSEIHKRMKLLRRIPNASEAQLQEIQETRTHLWEAQIRNVLGASE